MSHLDSIAQAIDKHGPLTRGELLEMLDIKDTVLDATLTVGRKRGRLMRMVDSGRWEVVDDGTFQADDDQVDPVETPAKPTATAEAPVQQAAGVTVLPERTIAALGAVHASPPKPKHIPTPEHVVQVGKLRIVVSGVEADHAGPILAAALQAAVEVFRR